ncbi:MAG: tetratricopeptide repeat protein [Sediminimonas sp.]|uniref:tetratricopeptide repeat protein n=1 Tax=Sediminimonas sp. TaxID=2823379 RepID=UPI00286FC682|nr:tetratricopeptide repeat protein [Sediminimonas sp.]MDR9484518.1 tetratricopeptide repeat protein [Sediminimonas sp.]
MAGKLIFAGVAAAVFATVANVGPVRADDDVGAYLAGRQAASARDFRSAAEYFTRALVSDPSNPDILEKALLSHLAVGNMDRAVPIARKIEADQIESQLARLTLLAHEASVGNSEVILSRIDEGHGVGPLVDGLATGWALMASGDVSAALAAFDDVTGQEGLAGFASYHKALALASVGDFEGAEAIFAESEGSALQNTRRGIVARVQLLSQLGQSDKAIELIDQVGGSDSDPEMKALRAALTTGEAMPFTHLQTARQGMAEVFHSVAMAINGQAEPEYTLIYARMAQFLRPQHTDALLMSAALLEELDRHEMAVEAYRKVPRDDPAFASAELGRAEALRQADRTDAAIEVLKQLAQTNGDLPAVHVSLGDLMRQLERYEEAVAAYDVALDLYEEEKTDQWFIHYARAISHERLDQWPQAEADFRKALELNPEQPQILNYLGYSLVEKRQKLDEALDMIERAVEAQPDSGYIVDSLGWALYRLGRYKEAVPHMERAVELMPVDPVVNDHLGDVLWAVGRKREAEFQWSRALSFIDQGEASEDIDPERVRRKLEVGLDKVLAEEGSDPLKVANGD